MITQILKYLSNKYLYELNLELYSIIEINYINKNTKRI